MVAAWSALDAVAAVASSYAVTTAVSLPTSDTATALITCPAWCLKNTRLIRSSTEDEWREILTY